MHEHKLTFLILIPECCGLCIELRAPKNRETIKELAKEVTTPLYTEIILCLLYRDAKILIICFSDRDRRQNYHITKSSIFAK